MYTYEAILKRMLDRVPGDLDKREGSVIYNALAPSAAELAQAYIKVFDIENRTYADTAYDEDLRRRTAERGVILNQATKALRKGIFNIDIPINSRFNGGDLNYIARERISYGVYKMECETAGSVGNYYYGTLLPIEYIDGLKSAEISDVIIPGEDVEDNESLRKRYFSTFDSESFGGNIQDYKEKTNSLAGVGGTKVYPAWNGGGTVKLVIIDSNYKKPSVEVVYSVQTATDPVENQGKGLGIAPIGHTVTVEGVMEKVVDIQSNITLQSGYVWDDVEAAVKEVILNYFTDLNKTWEESTNLVVRISQIETRILNVNGVLDIQNTLLNGNAANLVLRDIEIAALGEVTAV
jgi:uncharacterized phage protein gp47/JayE